MTRSLLLISALLLVNLPAFAIDRVQLVQSKLQTSLSAILPRTDFIVIVNRVDSLEDGGTAQTVDGSVKMLPGLQLGVDSKGEIVRGDQGASSYNGPVSIQVMVEEKVRPETFKTIKNLIPEIVGGVRDDDEIKVTTGPLRQAPTVMNNSTPQITIQNSPDRNQTQENIKFLALLLVTGGLFFWFLSKLNFGDKFDRQSGANPSPYRSGESEDTARSAEVAPADFSVLDPEAVGLFLLREVRQENPAAWLKWLKSAPSLHQREVFKHLPSWVLAYLQDLITTEDEQMDAEELSLHSLFNKIVLIEQSFKTPSQKKKAFLQWFPAKCLRFVPKKYQSALSDRSKIVLWSLRPDLGNLVRSDSLPLDQAMTEPTDTDLEFCHQELFSFPSVTLEQAANETKDVVLRWANMINQLTEFSPIESQLHQAELKLSSIEYARLLRSVAHLTTPFEFNESTRREWLRTIEADDYYYWLHLVKTTPGWQLENELRPMRLAMFRESELAKVHESWSEEDRKRSGARILHGFRITLDPNFRNMDSEAA